MSVICFDFAVTQAEKKEKKKKSTIIVVNNLRTIEVFESRIGKFTFEIT
jgi:hypothetical protein